MNNQHLENYINIVVKIGLGIEKGDDVVIWSAIESYDVTRKIVKKCYALGAKEVTVDYFDQYVDLERIMNTPMEVLAKYPGYAFDEFSDRAKKGASVLMVWSIVPNLNDVADKKRLMTFMKAFNKAKSPLWKQFIDGTAVRSFIATPFLEWSKYVYEGVEEQESLERLWEAVFSVTRADQENYLEQWENHIATLEKVTNRLNELGIDSIRLKTGGSDVTIGLSEKTKWHSALLYKENGKPYFVNIPSEEVFTTPHKYRINGHLTSTEPVSYLGNYIDGIRFEIKDGKITSYSAEIGQDKLESLLKIDDNALYFGEIALVPKSSPIAKCDTLFYNLLYDENASSHMAFGAGYTLCIKGADSMTDEEKDANGINVSNIHLDFMIGDDELNVTAVLQNGKTIQIMKDGEWTEF